MHSNPFLTHPEMIASPGQPKAPRAGSREPWGPDSTSPKLQRGLGGQDPTSPGLTGRQTPVVDPRAPSLVPFAPQSCPDGARDFRAEQCAEFDGQEFQGRRYKWLPYYGGKCASPSDCCPSLRCPMLGPIFGGSLCYTDCISQFSLPYYRHVVKYI